MTPLPSTSGAIKKPKITVADLVNNAIEKLNEKKGSLLYAIKKYIENNNTNIDIKKLKFHIHKYLKKSVENNTIKSNSQGNLLAGSFKMVRTKATKDATDNKSKKIMKTQKTMKTNKTNKTDEKQTKNMNDKKTVKKSIKQKENGASTDKVVPKKQTKQKVNKMVTKEIAKKNVKNITITLEELNNSLLEKINKSKETEQIKKKTTTKPRKSLSKNQLKKMKTSTIVRLPRTQKSQVKKDEM